MSVITEIEQSIASYAQEHGIMPVNILISTKNENRLIEHFENVDKAREDIGKLAFELFSKIKDTDVEKISFSILGIPLIFESTSIRI